VARKCVSPAGRPERRGVSALLLSRLVRLRRDVDFPALRGTQGSSQTSSTSGRACRAIDGRPPLESVSHKGTLTATDDLAVRRRNRCCCRPASHDAQAPVRLTVSTVPCKASCGGARLVITITRASIGAAVSPARMNAVSPSQPAGAAAPDPDGREVGGGSHTRAESGKEARAVRPCRSALPPFTERCPGLTNLCPARAFLLDSE
jgi:hypothetical protein